MSNVITCPNLQTFSQLCALFVGLGLTFRGNADALTITLTGGY